MIIVVAVIVMTINSNKIVINNNENSNENNNENNHENNNDNIDNNDNND